MFFLPTITFAHRKNVDSNLSGIGNNVQVSVHKYNCTEVDKIAGVSVTYIHSLSQSLTQ